MTSSNSNSKNTKLILWVSDDAAYVTGGQALGGEWKASGISIDSRTLQPGDLFIALIGERDGHDFVQQAFEKGAAAAIISKNSEEFSKYGPVLCVKDTFKALQSLGTASRQEFGGTVIGITGSVGKTGTKEMLAGCLSDQAQVYASKSSFNNHLGVPISLASLHSGHDVGVIEMGMNHAGEIRKLTKMARPNIAIITAVEAVHIENFDSVEGIADAKAEIFEGMDAGGKAVLNLDNPYFARVKAAARTQGVEDIYTFGEHEKADARLINVIEAANGLRMTADILDEKVECTLQYSGRHQAMNALAVLLAARLAGYDVQKTARALGRIEPMAGRGKTEEIDYGDKDNPVTLIDESYNASPVAMKAAFKVLALIDPGRGGRRIAILGDMLELGDDSARYHADLALPLKASNIDFVYTCGSMMKHLHQNLPEDQRGEHKETSEELARIVPDAIAPGDVVMVKGSLGSNMKVVVEALRSHPQKAGKTKSNGAAGEI